MDFAGCRQPSPSGPCRSQVWTTGCSFSPATAAIARAKPLRLRDWLSWVSFPLRRCSLLRSPSRRCWCWVVSRWCLTALVGWSFLKIALIGPQQRVTRTDVLLLAASSVFGLALATILLLTTSAYARLSADVDAQLKQLAEHLNTNLTREIDDAYSQATALTKHLRAPRASPYPRARNVMP